MRLRVILVFLGMLSFVITAPAPSSYAAQRCFTETNQCMDGRIAEFWEQNGGLAVFGFPIGPLEQTTVDGKTFTVQRFERNRLELHPENKRPYDVLLGRLGADRLGNKAVTGSALPRAATPAAVGCLPRPGMRSVAPSSRHGVPTAYR